ncbi:MAG TPA: FkbM family methyltransferase [Candidatus Limnocylindria bacterium]|jgi:FkbM family methyltransferase|nr:FkbM family methyltransferase [Candidatus Limnocylindria bacterium]
MREPFQHCQRSGDLLPAPLGIYGREPMNWLALLRYRHRCWKARRRSEHAEITALLGLIQHGDTVLDLGAHKGSYLYWLRQAAGAEGRVLAFEPQPALAGYLRQVVQAMRWENVSIENQGVSERPGSLTLHVPGPAGSISPGATFEPGIVAEANGQTAEVGVTTLDELFPAGSPPPSFIKCDVEGHELAVFRGGERLLRTAGPALLFECEARHLGSRPMSEVWDTLAGWGYTGEFFAPEGLRPVAEFRPDLHQNQEGGRFWDRPGYCNNFLFQHRP